MICHNRKALVAIVSGLFLLPLQVASEQWSIDVLGNDIALGMDRQVVLTKLKNYRIECFGETKTQASECDSLLVLNNGPQFVAQANVFIQRGKVQKVRKYWSPDYEESEPGKFVKTLYSLLAMDIRKSTVPFHVSVAERHNPGFHEQTISLISGRRTIEILYVEGFRETNGDIAPPYVMLEEVIE